MWKFGRCIGHLEKAYGLSHTQINIVPGIWPPTGSLSPSPSRPPLSPLPFPLSLTWWSIWQCVWMLSPGNRRPCSLSSPGPMDTRRGPVTGSSGKWAKLPGWPLGSHLWASKDQALKMEQELWALVFVLILLRTFGLYLGLLEEMNFDRGSLPISQITKYLNKILFLFAAALASWVWLLWQLVAEPSSLAGITGRNGNTFKTPGLLIIVNIPTHIFALNCHCLIYSVNKIWSCFFTFPSCFKNTESMSP